MADFCRACSLNLFGNDYGELAGLCPEGQVAVALCEGCGPVCVNRAGECVSGDCRHAGQEGHGVPVAPDANGSLPALLSAAEREQLTLPDLDQLKAPISTIALGDTTVGEPPFEDDL